MGKLRQLSTAVILIFAVALASAVIAQVFVPWSTEAWNGWRNARVVREHWDSVIAEGGVIPGRASLIQIVEFGDYQCPFCRDAHLAISRRLAAGASGSVFFFHLLGPGSQNTFKVTTHAADGRQLVQVALQEVTYAR